MTQALGFEEGERPHDDEQDDIERAHNSEAADERHGQEAGDRCVVVQAEIRAEQAIVEEMIKKARK